MCLSVVKTVYLPGAESRLLQRGSIRVENSRPIDSGKRVTFETPKANRHQSKIEMLGEFLISMVCGRSSKQYEDEMNS